MATTTEQLRIILEAQDRASAVLRNARRQLQGAGTDATTAGRKTRQAGDEMARGLSEADRAAQSLAGGLSGLAAAAGVGGLLLIARQAVSAGMELSSLGVQSRNVGAAFEAGMGNQATAAIERLREASRGQISDMDLMLSANRAMMLGVTQDAEEMARLMEVAIARGGAMGLTATQAFNDLVTGIGRAQPEILDNLGILTGGQAGYAAYAKSIGKTAQELTELEKRQYLVNKVLSETPASAATATNSIATIGVAWQNLWTAFGEGLSIGGDVGGLSGFFSGLTDYVKRSNEAAETSDQFSAKLKELYKSGEITWGELVLLNAQVEGAAFQFQVGASSSDEFRSRLAELHPELALLIEELAVTERQAVATNTALLGKSSARQTYEAAKLRAAVNMGQGMGMDPSFVGRLPNQGREFEYSAADAVRADEQALKDIQSRWDREAKAQISGARSYASAVDDAARAAEQAAEDMRGRIDRAFSTSSVTDRDWWETNTGQYQDKPDEYLRRLRSAVSDANSLWKDLLGGRTGDEAKLYLAQQEDAWRTGQWGQLGPGFDAEASTAAIKNAVRREIEAERSRQAIIESILNDPEMLGMGLSQGEMAKAMGVENYQASGADAVAQMVSGASATDFGAEITATITAQFRAKTSEWQAIGKAMMEAFLTGGKGAVSPMTMDAFAAAMWPELAPKVQQVVAGGYPG
jgi:hypothetical protein